MAQDVMMSMLKDRMLTAPIRKMIFSKVASQSNEPAETPGGILSPFKPAKSSQAGMDSIAESMLAATKAVSNFGDCFHEFEQCAPFLHTIILSSEGVWRQSLDPRSAVGTCVVVAQERTAERGAADGGGVWRQGDDDRVVHEAILHGVQDSGRRAAEPEQGLGPAAVYHARWRHNDGPNPARQETAQRPQGGDQPRGGCPAGSRLQRNAADGVMGIERICCASCGAMVRRRCWTLNELVQPSSWHRLPPPCAMQAPVSPMADLRQPSSWMEGLVHVYIHRLCLSSSCDVSSLSLSLSL